MDRGFQTYTFFLVLRIVHSNKTLFKNQINYESGLHWKGGQEVPVSPYGLVCLFIISLPSRMQTLQEQGFYLTCSFCIPSTLKLSDTGWAHGMYSLNEERMNEKIFETMQDTSFMTAINPAVSIHLLRA